MYPVPRLAGREMQGDRNMPRGDKGAYTDKQKRKAAHIEESYEDRGVPKRQAEARAWATVNRESGGGNKSAPAAARRTRTSRRRAAAGPTSPARPSSGPRRREKAG